MADFELRGLSDLQTRIKSIDRASREALNDSVEEEADMIVAKAKAMTPVKSGELRDSIRVMKSGLSQGRNSLGHFTEGADVVVAFTAGDDSIPYTLAIHEHPSPHDPPSWEGVSVQFHPEGTGPKFLERPFNESIAGMAQRIGSKIGSKLG